MLYLSVINILLFISYCTILSSCTFFNPKTLPERSLRVWMGSMCLWACHRCWVDWKKGKTKTSKHHEFRPCLKGSWELRKGNSKHSHPTSFFFFSNSVFSSGEYSVISLIFILRPLYSQIVGLGHIGLS